MLYRLFSRNTGGALRSMSTMRQVVLQAPGPYSALQPEIVIYKPAKLEKNHARIRVAACAVAYRDIIDRNGGFPFMNRPTVLGHEFAGVVDAVGEGSTLKPGDKVVSLHWAQFGGDAFPSPFTHKDAMKTFLGLTCNGGYAEYVTTHETAFVAVPNAENWSAVYASPVMSTFGTVWQGAVVRGKLTKGESVLVTGAAGGVGGAAVAMAARLGCHVIGATGSVNAKGAYIKSLGCDEIVDSSPGFSKKVKPVDMVIECVGAPTFNDSLRSLKPGGRLVLIGNVTNASVQLPLGLCIVKSLNIIGTDSIEADELRKLFVWLEEEGLRPVVDRILSLEEVGAAHQLLEERQVSGRIVLDVNKKLWK